MRDLCAGKGGAAHAFTVRGVQGIIEDDASTMSARSRTPAMTRFFFSSSCVSARVETSIVEGTAATSSL